MMNRMKLRKNLNALGKHIKTLLLKGVTRQKLALTIATGSIIGLFPVIGTTTVMASLVALGLRLNQAFIQVVNYTVYPLQLLLFIPFLKLGNNVFPLTSNKVDFHHLFQLLQNDTLHALTEFSYVLIAAILLWFVVSIPLSLLIYYSSLKYMKRMNMLPNKRSHKQQTS